MRHKVECKGTRAVAREDAAGEGEDAKRAAQSKGKQGAPPPLRMAPAAAAGVMRGVWR